MPRRDQWKKNSVGRDKNSVGRDETSQALREIFYTRDEASHGFHARTQRFFFTEIAQNVSFFR
jgi:hypothetical protein